MPGTPTEIAGKAMGKAKAAVSTLKGATGIMKTLAEEHGEVSMLLKRCKAATDGGSRRELFAEIRDKLLCHAHCEEQEFYAPLREHAETQEMATHSAREHKEIETKVKALSATDASTERWKDLFSELADTVSHHVKEEENELFPRAQKALSTEQLDAMNDNYLRSKQEYQHRTEM